MSTSLVIAPLLSKGADFRKLDLLFVRLIVQQVILIFLVDL